MVVLESERPPSFVYGSCSWRYCVSRRVGYASVVLIFMSSLDYDYWKNVWCLVVHSDDKGGCYFLGGNFCEAGVISFRDSRLFMPKICDCILLYLPPEGPLASYQKRQIWQLCVRRMSNLESAVGDYSYLICNNFRFITDQTSLNISQWSVREYPPPHSPPLPPHAHLL